jgi:hypothetical protein
MPELPTPHPDRAAATLVNLLPAPGAPFAPPGAGSADCRIDLKLLQWRALAVAAHCAPSAAHLAPLARERHPDLWAGTVQDGVARGFAARLEEAIALAPAPAAPRPLAAEADARVSSGRELRKRKDLLVASGGARVRFARKTGVLFVDREAALQSANCLRFEARSDRGTLDEFVAAPDERPRLYSAQFLQATQYVECAAGYELRLAGRLGRGAIGWNTEVTLSGRADEDVVRLVVRIEQRLVGWRLRARFLGLPGTAIAHECTPVREAVATDAGGFVAFTLVRAVDVLQVGERSIAAPAAACRGWIEHTFRLGSQA